MNKTATNTDLSRGRLYVFEGADGVGKSSIVKDVNQRLTNMGHTPICLSFPGRMPGSIGKLIYDVHHDHAKYGITDIHPLSLQILHVAAHVDCITKQIIPALKQGRTVLLDRFWWSTMAYGESAGISSDILGSLRAVEGKIWGTIQPNCVFYIKTKQAFRTELSDQQWTLVTRNYSRLISTERDNHPIKVIENSGTVEQACKKICKVIETAVDQNKHCNDELIHSGRGGIEKLPSLRRKKQCANPWAPAKTTLAYETYWKFAAERQAVFFRRLNGAKPPLTDDPIIQAHKFTNAYRASDRVSQYLIRNVIYQGDQSPTEVFFRTILFKTFNKIETWEALSSKLGPITYSDFELKQYDRVLTQLLKDEIRIYSAAYIMPSGGKVLGHSVKHRNNLELIAMMMKDDVPSRICDAKNMQAVFEMLRSYPTIGDFLAYQYATDLNYSNLTNFSEMSFVVPGPGARDGIRKCFSDFGGLTEVDLIKCVADRQHSEFERLGIPFQDLWGRPLQLIDCQNLFCEVDKYARVAHPSIQGRTGRTKIKQKYKITPEPIAYFYPPKWGINTKVNKG